MTLPPTVSRRIVESEDCWGPDPHWLWQGSLTSAGYGHVTLNGAQVYVHRLVYKHMVDDIPAGLEIDHMCLVRHCCNPAHLDVVTHSENMRRIAQRQTACNAGHPYTDGSFVVRRGTRECLICRREWNNTYWRRRRREAGYVPPEERTTCAAGHEYNETNTRIDTLPDGRTKRHCRPCAAAAKRERNRRKREAA